MIKKYFENLKLIQKTIRSFLATKHARIFVLNKLWLNIEINYIKKNLELREKNKSKNDKKSKKNIHFDFIDEKSLMEMRKQNQLW